MDIAPALSPGDLFLDGYKKACETLGPHCSPSSRLYQQLQAYTPTPSATIFRGKNSTVSKHLK
jgi:hypothetical protein